jgi:hypothetical protein
MNSAVTYQQNQGETNIEQQMPVIRCFWWWMIINNIHKYVSATGISMIHTTNNACISEVPVLNYSKVD